MMSIWASLENNKLNAAAGAAQWGERERCSIRTRLSAKHSEGQIKFKKAYMGSLILNFRILKDSKSSSCKSKNNLNFDIIFNNITF